MFIYFAAAYAEDTHYSRPQPTATVTSSQQTPGEEKPSTSSDPGFITIQAIQDTSDEMNTKLSNVKDTSTRPNKPSCQTEMDGKDDLIMLSDNSVVILDDDDDELSRDSSCFILDKTTEVINLTTDSETPLETCADVGDRIGVSVDNTVEQGTSLATHEAVEVTVTVDSSDAQDTAPRESEARYTDTSDMGSNVVFKCDFCKYVNPDQEAMVNHMKANAHNRASTFKTTATGELLAMELSGKPLRLPTCQVSSRVVKCVTCGKIFDNILECSLHFNYVHDLTKFKYGLCDLLGDAEAGYPASGVCETCGQVSSTAKQYAEHCEEASHWPFKQPDKLALSFFCCQTHSQKKHSFESMCEHMQQAHKHSNKSWYKVYFYSPYVEENVLLVSERLQRSDGITESYQQQKRKANSTKNGAIRPKKGKMTRDERDDLIGRADEDEDPEEDAAMLNRTPIFKCDYCDVTAETELNMRNHLQAEKHCSGSKVYKMASDDTNCVYLAKASCITQQSNMFSTCGIICPAPGCSNLYKMPETCVGHYIGTHKGEERIYNVHPVVHKSFFTYTVKAKNHICCVCNERFAQLKKLSHHLQRSGHSFIEPRENCVAILVCTVCSASYHAFSAMMKHLLNDHKRGVNNCTFTVNTHYLDLTQSKTIHFPSYGQDKQGEFDAVIDKITDLKTIMRSKKMGKKGKRAIRKNIRKYQNMVKGVGI